MRSRGSFCGSPDHAVSRRAFLGAAAAAPLAADMTRLAALADDAPAADLKRQQKRVVVLWLAGGASQLETFDPKPGTPTGGPFRAIPTNVPGLHVSELMPKMAARMQDTVVVRSLNTKNADHVAASKIMMRGRRDEAGLKYPDLGAVVSRELGRVDAAVPNYVSFYAQTEGRDFAPGSPGFLGARYASMDLTDSLIPKDLRRPDGLSEADHRERAELRDLLGRSFARGRETPALGSHNEAYQRVRGLMSSEALFDISREPEKVRERYGRTQFGEQALVTRRLVEAGVPFVRLARAWWDSHAQNFETHQEMVPELDHVMATLLDDLSERGLLEHTLVVTLSEFGRTPAISPNLGREHFASAWSCTLTGMGVKRGGGVYGKTDATGRAVVEGEMNAAALYATIYAALGVNPHKNYYAGPRPIPLVDAGAEPVREILA